MDIDEREIERMMRLTGGSRDQCHFFLEACGGNFERAVDMLRGTFSQLYRRCHPAKYGVKMSSSVSSLCRFLFVGGPEEL